MSFFQVPDVSKADHNHANGAAGCPVCAPHDHSDNRLAGTSDGVDIPMWHLNCPKCGTTDIPMTGWTPVAIAYARSLRQEAS